MSIPKEPRQLMINLMYLVLTALLALNVSAEVMNAFFSLDKGMKTSGDIVENNNKALMAGITKQAQAYPSPTAQDYEGRATKALEISKSFYDYIEGIRKDLFEKAGGENPKAPGQPKDIRNKDLTTRMFVNEGLGDQIKTKIEETRTELLKLADNDATVTAAFPLAIEDIPPGTSAKTWSEFKFKQMPVAAIFPILGKIQSDAKNSSTAVLNYCATKVGGVDVKFDEFEPVVSAKKGYIIMGEKYEADVFLSARSSKADNISISVDGNGLPVTAGKAQYTASANSLGTKKYHVNIRVTNPLDKTSKDYGADFEYEVGQRSFAVQLDKMNVFYIGVDNPITVSAAGVSSNDVKVTASGVTATKKSGGAYVVTATTPGEAKITVAGGGASQTFTYRVKRIPDPIPLLGGQHKSKQMGNGEFRAQGGISAKLENFDFEAQCQIVSFEAVYLKKRQDPSSPRVNSGARWTSEVQGWISQANPGDAYFFDNIKARCPGDQVPRDIGGLAFKIK